MAVYTLKFRRGTTIPSLVESEPFFKTDSDTLHIGDGSSNITLLKLGSNTGNVSFVGDISASNISVTNDITIGGNIILGDAIQDSITVSGQFDSHLIPSESVQFDLGSNSKKWNTVYASTGQFDNLDLGGTGVVSGSSQFTASYDARYEQVGNGIVSGSSQITFDDLTSLPSGIVSGSSQVSYVGLSNIPNGIVSGSIQITGGSGLLSGSKTNISSLNAYTASNDITNTTQDSRLDQLSTETGSITTEQEIQDDRLDNLELESGSITSEQSVQDLRLSSLENETGSIESEQSVQDQRLSAIEADSGSYLKTVDISSDTNLAVSDTSEVNMILTGDTLSAELIGGVVSGSSQITITESQISDLSHTDISFLNNYTSSNDINITNIHSTTSSFESRLDLLSNVSHSHANKATLDAINQGLSTSDNVTFADADFTGDVQVTGNLTVLGSATEISSTELSIEDKLITVASGSADSAASDGAGIEIAGADKSLKWDHNTTSFVLNAKVSSSVGFKGEGGELTGIDTDQVNEGSNLYYTDTRVKTKLDAEGVITGSSQLTSDLDSRYLEINGDSVFSSSIQVNADSITNFDANVFDILGAEDIHSGSYLGNATTTNLTEGTNLYWTETRFSESLDDRGVISGSSQTLEILNSLNTYTGSNNTINNGQDSRLDQLSTETGSIESEQEVQDQRLSAIEADSGSYLKTVDISTDTNLAVSDTSQVNMILTGDTLSAELIGGVVSGSNQLSSTFLSKLGDSVVSSSTFSSPSQGTIRATINGADTDVDSGLQTTDTPSFEGISLTSVGEVGNIEFSALFVSSSNLLGTRELGTAAFLHYSSSIADGNSQVIGTAQATKNYIDGKIIEAGAGDITEVNAGLGLSGGALSGSATLTLDTGSAHFLNGVSAAGAPAGTISGSSQITSLGFISSSDSTLSLNAYTASNDTNITNIHSTTSSFDSRLDNIESFTSSLDDSYVTESELAAATGALETKDSEQDLRLSNIESFTSSLDDSYVTEAELAAATGALETKDSTQDTRLDQLSTETGSIATEQSVQDSRLSNIEAATGSYLTTVDISTDTNLAVSDTSEVNMILTDDTLSAELIGGVVSGSSQVLDILSSLNTYTSSNDNDITELFSSSSNHEGRIDTLEGNVHEDPLTFNDTTQVDLIRAGNVITANLKGNVVSGSAQITDVLTSVNAYTASNDTTNTGQNSRLDQLSTETGSIESEQSVQDQRLSAIEADSGSYLKTVDISSDTNLAVSDTSTINMTLSGDTLSADVIGGVVSGSASDVKSFLSISSSDISDVAAFSQSGTYANLRAQSTTKGDVGLGNVTNESKSTMFTSPTFTGTPVSTTPSSNDNSTKIATTAYVQGELTDLVGTAGSTLDTLGELSASLADDSGSLASLVTTVGTKLAKSSNLSDLANASTARTNLGVAIGSDVQAHSSVLDNVAAETYTGDNSITTVGTITTGVWNGTAISTTYIENTSGTNTGDESDASATVKGIVELATTAETTTGTDATRAVTPDGLKDGYQGSTNVTTLGTIGTGTWQGTVIGDAYLSANTAHLSGTQTFTGAKSFDEAVNINKTTASISKTTGALIVDGGVGIAGALNVGGDVVAFASSDERLKNELIPISNPLEKINSIGGYSFEWNEQKQDIYKGKDYGVVAQEIEKILPELVHTRENGYKAVKYDKLISLLIEGIKELSNEVNKLKENN